MLARDVMFSPVITATPDTKILDVVQLMLDNRISAVPIVDDDDKLVGLVSEGDLLRRAEIGTERHRSWWLTAFRGAVSLAEEFTKSHSMKASEVMTKPVVTASEDTPLQQIAEILEKKKFKRVPVVRDGRVVGIVSRANLLQALTTQQEKMADTPSKDDRVIREAILKVLQGEKWSNMSHLNLVVLDGVVHFWGLVASDAQRQAVIVAAESVPGVRDIVDHMLDATMLNA
jgi:CBS domain-containing protein